MSITLLVQGLETGLFFHGTLRAGCALWRPARTRRILTVLAWSPDRARPLTFRSQKNEDPIITVVYQGRKIRRPTVKTTRWSFQEALHSETGENKNDETGENEGKAVRHYCCRYNIGWISNKSYRTCYEHSPFSSCGTPSTTAN